MLSMVYTNRLNVHLVTSEAFKIPQNILLRSANSLPDALLLLDGSATEGDIRFQGISPRLPVSGDLYVYFDLDAFPLSLALIAHI